MWYVQCACVYVCPIWEGVWGGAEISTDPWGAVYNPFFFFHRGVAIQDGEVACTRQQPSRCWRGGSGGMRGSAACMATEVVLAGKVGVRLFAIGSGGGGIENISGGRGWEEVVVWPYSLVQGLPNVPTIYSPPTIQT